MNKEKQSGNCKNYNSHEKQQIEEMAKAIGRFDCYDCDNCKCVAIKSENVDCIDYALAEHLIVANNYRKQSEGEWVVEAYPVDSDEVIIIPYKEHQHNEPFCSLCGKYALLDGGGEYVTSNFCPNCGAKMKGGAE